MATPLWSTLGVDHNGVAIGAGLCIAFCPRDVFVAGADGHPIVVNPERCTACMWCAEHCPDFAIEVGLEDESTERRDAA
ncbi:MAG TPA: 4Fe-4S binding protein, partial [Anaerolineae bacterium]|nr:4Fe-4S binding protein [Anaerolineae bacterium]